MSAAEPLPLPAPRRRLHPREQVRDWVRNYWLAPTLADDSTLWLEIAGTAAGCTRDDVLAAAHRGLHSTDLQSLADVARMGERNEQGRARLTVATLAHRRGCAERQVQRRHQGALDRLADALRDWHAAGRR